jgi:hypothetical protein
MWTMASAIAAEMAEMLAMSANTAAAVRLIVRSLLYPIIARSSSHVRQAALLLPKMLAEVRKAIQN